MDYERYLDFCLLLSVVGLLHGKWKAGRLIVLYSHGPYWGLGPSMVLQLTAYHSDFYFLTQLYIIMYTFRHGHNIYTIEKLRYY